MDFKSAVRYKSILVPAVAPLQLNWWIIQSLTCLYFKLVCNYVDGDVVELSELNYLRSLYWILSVNLFISLSPWHSISHPALNLCSPAQPQARHHESWAILTLYFGPQVPALPRPSSSDPPLLIRLSLSTLSSLSSSPYGVGFCLFSYHAVFTMTKKKKKPALMLTSSCCCGEFVLSILHLFPFFLCTLPLSAFSTFALSVLHSRLMYH